MAADLEVRLKALDENFIKGFEKAVKAVESLEKRVKRAEEKTTTSLRKMGSAFRSFGSAALSGIKRLTSALSSFQSLVVGGGIVVGLQKAVSAASDFEKGLAEISTLMEGYVVPAMDMYNEALREMVKTSSRTLNDLTKGLYQTLSAGVTDSAKALALLDSAQKAAVAGLTDVSVAVDAGTTLVNAFRLETDEVTKAYDILFTTVRRGKTTFEPLAGAIGKVATIASQSGVKMEEVGASIATLTKAGLNVDIATTALRQLFANLLKPSEDAKKALSALNLEWGTSALAGGNFTETIKKMNEATGGNAELLVEIIPNIRAVQAAMVLAGEQIEVYNEDLKAINESTGAANEAFNKMAETSSEKLAVQWQRLSLIAQQIGEKLLPTVVEWLTKIADWAETHSAEIVEGVWQFVNGLTTVLEVLKNILRVATAIITLGISEYLASLDTGAEARQRQRKRDIEEQKFGTQLAEEFIGGGGAAGIREFSQFATAEESIRFAREERRRLIEKAAEFAAMAEQTLDFPPENLRDFELANKLLAEQVREIDKLINSMKTLSQVEKVKHKVDIEAILEKKEKQKEAASAARAEAKQTLALLDRLTEKQLSPLEQLERQYEEFKDKLRGNREALLRVDEWYLDELDKLWEKWWSNVQKLRKKAIKAAGEASQEAAAALRRELGGELVTPAEAAKAETLARREAALGEARIRARTVGGEVGTAAAQAGGPIVQGAVRGGISAGPLGAVIGGALSIAFREANEENRAKLEEDWRKRTIMMGKVGGNILKNAAVLIRTTLSELPGTIIQTLSDIDIVSLLAEGVFKGLVEFFGNIGGSIKKFFSGGGKSGFATFATLGISRLFHEGGVVGQGGNQIIKMADTVARRLEVAHDGKVIGLRNDEVPSILQTGEGVLSRRGMDALGRLNSGQGISPGGSAQQGAASPVKIDLARGGNLWIVSQDPDTALDGVVSRLLDKGTSTGIAMSGRTGRIPGLTTKRR